MITVPRETCIDLDQALNKEWLVSNGIGGYASGTVAGINTRKYHGLLVAALKPPVGRTVLLAKIDEEANVGGRTFYLGANEYPGGTVRPDGFIHIAEFSIRDGIVSTTFRLGDAALRKTVWMEHGQNATYIRYTYEGSAECALALHAMCNYRDYHSTTNGLLDWEFGVEELPGGCMVTAWQGATPFWLTTTPNADFTHTGVWYWSFVYRAEVARGFDDTDDLYVPGIFRTVLQSGQSITFVASTEPPEVTTPQIEDALERERARARGLYKAAGLARGAENGEAADPHAPVEAMVAQLVLAAGSFIVQRKVQTGGDTIDTPSVLAGYHWFTDWGRDTMISLPGLTLPTGRTKEAGKILQTFGIFTRDGLIPNNFPDSGGPRTTTQPMPPSGCSRRQRGWHRVKATSRWPATSTRCWPT